MLYVVLLIAFLFFSKLFEVMKSCDTHDLERMHNESVIRKLKSGELDPSKQVVQLYNFETGNFDIVTKRELKDLIK